jgi:pimeloyl-ACP methyl ester carboxylesterase
MILHSLIVEQAIDLDDRAHFVKELVLARGPMPIAMVRKRAALLPKAGSSERADPTTLAAPTRGTLLLIHGYGQNRYAFHLPSRSMVNYLARAGYDVFNVDLRGRGRSSALGAKRPRSVLDFIREDVPSALDEIAKLSGDRPVYLIGHSLGGVVSYCVAVEHRSRVAGVVSLGSPYHFTVGSRWLAGVTTAFMMLDKRMALPNLPVPTRAYGRFVRMARWAVESPLWPIPFRGFQRHSIEPEVLEQHMSLAMDRGSIATMRAMFGWAQEVRARADADDGLFGYAKAFEALDVPLLVVAGQHDDLAPPASVKPAFSRSHARDKTYRELPFGHVDMLIGREASQLTWALLESWLNKRTDRRTSSAREPTVAPSPSSQTTKKA